MSSIARMLLLLCTLWASAQAQEQVVFTISKVPEYTPPNDTLFLTGEFNQWQLADSNYMFRRLPDGSYRLALRLGSLRAFDYKINRGTWERVEGNDVGGYLANHSFRFADSVFEYRIEVKSWQDLHKAYYPPTTIRVLSVPANTPHDARIYVGGSFNGWNSRDPEFELKRAPDGTYFTEINSGLPSFQYKFTRGDWSTVEARWDGGVLSNRLHQATTNQSATIVVEIADWEDLSRRQWFWKIAHSFFFVQLLLIFFFLLRGGFERIWLWALLFFALAYLLRFVHSDNAYSALLPKGRLLSGWFLSFVAPAVYLWFQGRYGEQKRLGALYLLPLLPGLMLLFLWQSPDEQFSHRMITNEISYHSFSLYAYAVLLNVLFLVKGRRLMRRQRTRISAFHRALLNAVRTVIYLDLGLLLLAVVALAARADIKLVNDWFENLQWLLWGLSLVYAQLQALGQAEGLILQNQPVASAKESLPDKHRLALREKLLHLMEHKRLYTNAQLSLGELARELGTNTFYTSKLINEGFEMSFTDFVNSYRIRAFIREIELSDGSATFLYVAMSLGFNSKSSFNRAFKRATGKTPSEYFGHEQ